MENAMEQDCPLIITQEGKYYVQENTWSASLQLNNIKRLHM